jgi:predicted ATPase/class 3 adenylate cyclase/ribosomal protein L40E
MRCPKCTAENPDRARFCLECGASFGLRCAACGAELPSKARFCLECGWAVDTLQTTPPPEPRSYTPKHLADRILAEQAAMEARGAVDGERKTITALFADIKGSVELMEDLDPEEARGIVDPALQLMMDAVHRYEGYVAQSRGDGILALFGAPIAQEDHPQRALHAALRMQQEIKRYAERLRHEKGVNLEIRVGLNTGEVVVRSIRKDDLHTDYVPIGHSTNLAARLESLATPGSILVSEATRKLTDGYFRLSSLGAAKVKGVTEPVPIYEVLGTGQLRTKLELSVRRGLVKFVGRGNEMAQLQKSLDIAKSGKGQIVGVMGEPGVGKSRLFHEFKLRSGAGSLVLEAFAVSHGRASPYLPLIDLLRSYFGITLDDDERQRREKAIGKILALDRALEDTLPHVFLLLGILETTSPLHQMDPQIRRSRTFEAIKRVVLKETRSQPVVLIIEDVHWVDAETHAFLAVLGDGLPTARFLLLVNYRPEYQHPWGNKSYVTQLRLDPLEKDSAEEMLSAMVGDGVELAPLRREILEKSDGTPFFMEEIVQGLFERAILIRDGAVRITRPLSEIHIPATVEGMLAARIDLLAPREKELLQTAAVIGREFALALLEKVTELREETLRALLARLQEAEFVYEEPASEETAFIFKHALTRDVGYNSLLNEQRSSFHEKIAVTIEELYASRLEQHYSELAHHYGRGGNTKKAVQFLRLASQQALERSAHTEALAQLATALRLLESLPETAERAQQELSLRAFQGASLVATKGYGAPEIEAAYGRARELCEQSGEIRELLPVLRGLWAFYIVRAQYETAYEISKQFLALAQDTGELGAVVQARGVTGFNLMFLGQFAAARDHCERGIELYDSARDGSLTALFGVDPGVDCRCYEQLILWCLGYPEQALNRSKEALALARERAHPYSSCWALVAASWLRQYCRDELSVAKHAAAVIALSDEHGFPFWRGWGTFLRGWSLSEQSQREGIEQMEGGLGAIRATGAIFGQSYWLALLATACAKVGKPAKGLDLLKEALAATRVTGERLYEAELHRLTGDLALQLRRDDHDAEPEACFRRAIEIARQQQSRALELRATTSLARLLQRNRKEKEARSMLADIYGWFTEGFDTADLKEAKALLEELS